MQTIQKICICCPAGCHLEITRGDDGAIKVSGNNCPRGDKYARQEVTDPRRTVTTTVAAVNNPHCRIPVKSTAPVPMAMIPELLQALYALEIPLPVALGDIILKDYRQSGIDIVATGAAARP